MTIEFERFVVEAEPKLRAAFVARYGPELGREATAEALAGAWERWPRVSTMTNPTGYVFRIGQSRIRRRRQAFMPAKWQSGCPPMVEPGLASALRRMSQRQREVVVLHHAMEWTYAEISAVLGISRGSVQRHAERGLRVLQEELHAEEARLD